MRVKVTLSYDGSKFNGFQIQNSGVKTVANRLDDILKSLHIETKIRASGRTDSGVHATNQVIDFNIPSFWNDLDKLKNILNQKAYPDIYIKRIEIVDEEFHSRFLAKRRVYRYLLSTKEPSVFLSSYILFVKSIDENRVKNAIKYFEGEHDFAFFKKSKSDEKNTIRTIYKCRFYRYRDIYVFTFEANGFLRSQIRMMVATLLQISDQKLTLKELKEQLSLTKRYSTEIVKPNGLYLSKVIYR